MSAMPGFILNIQADLRRTTVKEIRVLNDYIFAPVTTRNAEGMLAVEDYQYDMIY